MKSPVVKRSIVIAGHKTSVSLEDAFWRGLKDIAGDRNMTLSDMVASIDTDRHHGNLSSAIRLFVLDHYRGKTSPAPGDDVAPASESEAAGSEAESDSTDSQSEMKSASARHAPPVAASVLRAE
jgi:predicted DNA-binding ribbon-helix-helix protein